AAASAGAGFMARQGDAAGCGRIDCDRPVRCRRTGLRRAAAAPARGIEARRRNDPCRMKEARAFISLLQRFALMSARC
ncbi:MAG: hypothetical protein KGL18_13250, partial [Burkholderiales bacterium]|nr:hypothetical protein [Burkholderiales bacterium]